MIRSQEKSKARAQRRALMGKRPAGINLSRHADELSEEEDAMEDEKVGQSLHHSDESSLTADSQQEVNMFGHRFLLPYGRRLTQMEMDAAPVSHVFWSLPIVCLWNFLMLRLECSHPRRAKPIRIGGRKIAIWLRRQRR